MRVESKKDDIILKQAERLFYTYYEDFYEKPLDERKKARLVLRHLRDHIGNNRFIKVFQTSVQDNSTWAPDIVSAFSDHDDEDGENDEDHNFALCLTRAVLEISKSHGQRSREDESDRPPIDVEIDQWAFAQEDILSEINLLASARFVKSMLDHGLAQGEHRDTSAQHWAEKCFQRYFSVLAYSNVYLMEEGEFAESMLGTIKREGDSPRAQWLADRCFSLYADSGMKVHAIAFAQGMLGILRPGGSDIAELSFQWKQRCLSQERKRVRWRKVGDLTQAMLHAYLKCRSLPHIPPEMQLENAFCDPRQPEPRLLKIPFPDTLPRGLLNDVQAQKKIEKSVTQATRGTKGAPIDGTKVITEFQSAIRSWEADNSNIAIGAHHTR